MNEQPQTFLYALAESPVEVEKIVGAPVSIHGRPSRYLNICVVTARGRKYITFNRYIGFDKALKRIKQEVERDATSTLSTIQPQHTSPDATLTEEMLQKIL